MVKKQARQRRKNKPLLSSPTTTISSETSSSHEDGTTTSSATATATATTATTTSSSRASSTSLSCTPPPPPPQYVPSWNVNYPRSQKLQQDHHHYHHHETNNNNNSHNDDDQAVHTRSERRRRQQPKLSTSTATATSTTTTFPKDIFHNDQIPACHLIWNAIQDIFPELQQQHYQQQQEQHQTQQQKQSSAQSQDHEACSVFGHLLRHYMIQNRTRLLRQQQQEQLQRKQKQQQQQQQQTNSTVQQQQLVAAAASSSSSVSTAKKKRKKKKKKGIAVSDGVPEDLEDDTRETKPVDSTTTNTSSASAVANATSPSLQEQPSRHTPQQQTPSLLAGGGGNETSEPSPTTVLTSTTAPTANKIRVDVKTATMVTSLSRNDEEEQPIITSLDRSLLRDHNQESFDTTTTTTSSSTKRIEGGTSTTATAGIVGGNSITTTTVTTTSKRNGQSSSRTNMKVVPTLASIPSSDDHDSESKHPPHPTETSATGDLSSNLASVFLDTTTATITASTTTTATTAAMNELQSSISFFHQIQPEQDTPISTEKVFQSNIPPNDNRNNNSHSNHNNNNTNCNNDLNLTNHSSMQFLEQIKPEKDYHDRNDTTITTTPSTTNHDENSYPNNKNRQNQHQQRHSSSHGQDTSRDEILVMEKENDAPSLKNENSGKQKSHMREEFPSQSIITEESSTAHAASTATAATTGSSTTTIVTAATRTSTMAEWNGSWNGTCTNSRDTSSGDEPGPLSTPKKSPIDRPLITSSASSSSTPPHSNGHVNHSPKNMSDHDWVPEESGKSQQETPPGDVIKNPLELEFLLTTTIPEETSTFCEEEDDESSFANTSTTSGNPHSSSQHLSVGGTACTPQQQKQNSSKTSLFDEWFDQQIMNGERLTKNGLVGETTNRSLESFAEYLQPIFLSTGAAPKSNSKAVVDTSIPLQSVVDACRAIQCTQCRDSAIRYVSTLEQALFPSSSCNGAAITTTTTSSNSTTTAESRRGFVLNPQQFADANAPTKNIEVEDAFDYALLEEGTHPDNLLLSEQQSHDEFLLDQYLSSLEQWITLIPTTGTPTRANPRAGPAVRGTTNQQSNPNRSSTSNGKPSNQKSLDPSSTTTAMHASSKKAAKASGGQSPTNRLSLQIESLTLTHIQGLVQSFLIPCGIEETVLLTTSLTLSSETTASTFPNRKASLTIDSSGSTIPGPSTIAHKPLSFEDQIQSVQETVLEQATEVRTALDTMQSIGNTMRQQLNKILSSIARIRSTSSQSSNRRSDNNKCSPSPSEFTTFPLLKECDNMCTQYIEKLLNVLRLTQVTITMPSTSTSNNNAYHNSFIKGPCNSTGATTSHNMQELQLYLWTSYLRALEQTIKACDAYYTGVAEEMADQGNVPRMFVSPRLRDFFQELVENKIAIWTNLGSTFRSSLTNVVLKELYTHETWHDLHYYSNDSTGKMRKLQRRRSSTSTNACQPRPSLRATTTSNCISKDQQPPLSTLHVANANNGEDNCNRNNHGRAKATSLLTDVLMVKSAEEDATDADETEGLCEWEYVLDDLCDELIQRLSEWTETILGGRIGEIQRQRMAHTEQVLELLQTIVDPLSKEYSSVEKHFSRDRNLYFVNLRSNIRLAQGVRRRMRLIDQNEIEHMATGVILMWRHIRIMQSSSTNIAASMAASSGQRNIAVANDVNAVMLSSSTPSSQANGPLTSVPPGGAISTGTDMESLVPIPPLPLRLKKWMHQEDDESDSATYADGEHSFGKRNHKKFPCNGANGTIGGKRRVMCVLAGLVYQWLQDRCLEWNAKVAEQELLQSIELDKHDTTTTDTGESNSLQNSASEESKSARSSNKRNPSKRKKKRKGKMSEASGANDSSVEQPIDSSNQLATHVEPITTSEAELETEQCKAIDSGVTEIANISPDGEFVNESKGAVGAPFSYDLTECSGTPLGAREEQKLTKSTTIVRDETATSDAGDIATATHPGDTELDLVARDPIENSSYEETEGISSGLFPCTVAVLDSSKNSLQLAEEFLVGRLQAILTLQKTSAGIIAPRCLAVRSWSQTLDAAMLFLRNEKSLEPSQRKNYIRSFQQEFHKFPIPQSHKAQVVDW